MSLLRLWRVSRRRRANEAIFREELSAHLQALEERYRAEGLSAEAARTAARRQFGNATTVTEDVRAESSFGGLERLAQDVRYAARTLTASPGFTLMAADHAPGNRNTIVNEAIARRFFKNGDAIGKRWDWGNPVGPDGFVIVGVVEDAKYVDLRTSPPNMVYHLVSAQPDRALSDLEIRTAGSLTTMTAAVRQALADSEPRLPVLEVMPLSGRMAQRVRGASSGESRSDRRHSARLYRGA